MQETVTFSTPAFSDSVFVGIQQTRWTQERIRDYERKMRRYRWLRWFRWLWFVHPVKPIDRNIQIRNSMLISPLHIGTGVGGAALTGNRIDG